ncbi:MAG: hypothetical protein ACTH31_04670 [Pseudoclavibacter sp.]
MTSSHTTSAVRRVGGIGIAAGALLLTGGAGAWFAVTKQLRDERITIPGNADFLPGKVVQDPVTAYAESMAIKRNAEKASGGRTFADINAELSSLDGSSPEAAELRKKGQGLSAAASFRTSLMTSVLAYGVSALVAGLGAVFLVTGAQLRGARDE